MVQLINMFKDYLKTAQLCSWKKKEKSDLITLDIYVNNVTLVLTVKQALNCEKGMQGAEME